MKPIPNIEPNLSVNKGEVISRILKIKDEIKMEQDRVEKQILLKKINAITKNKEIVLEYSLMEKK